VCTISPLPFVAARSGALLSARDIASRGDPCRVCVRARACALDFYRERTRSVSPAIAPTINRPGSSRTPFGGLRRIPPVQRFANTLLPSPRPPAPQSAARADRPGRSVAASESRNPVPIRAEILFLPPPPLYLSLRRNSRGHEGQGRATFPLTERSDDDRSEMIRRNDGETNRDRSASRSSRANLPS